MKKTVLFALILSLFVVFCSVSLVGCGKSCREPSQDDPPHTHTLTNAFDAEGHWQQCACGYKTEKIAHTCEIEFDAEGHMQECECGYMTAKVAHSLEIEYDEEGHWAKCACGYNAEKQAHVFVGAYDDEGHWTACACGKATAKVAHDFKDVYDVDEYWQECACGKATAKQAYDGYKLISAAYDYTAEDFTLENFATSGKALMFEYKPVGDRLSGDSDDVTFSLMSGWDRVTAYITVDITNNTVRSNDVYIGKVEDAGDGWYKVIVNFAKMPLEASGTETVDRMYFHWVNRGFMLANVDIVNAYRDDIEISAAYDYTASDFLIENFATSGKALSFEYKRVEDGQAGNDVTFSLMSGWDRVTAYITVDITNNTVRSNNVYIGQVEDSGDGWYKITVNFAEMPLNNASGDETVDRMYFHWVDHAFLLADVEIVNAYRNGIEISAAYDYTAKDFSIEDFATSGKALTFAYKPVGDRLSDDSDDVTFSLMSGWDRVTAYITVDITNNTVRSNDVYIGQIEDAGDGWYKVTVNFSEMPLNASGDETIDRMYFHWVNHAFLLADVEIVNAYRNGIEISAAYDYTASDFSIENFATSGKALTFEYKPVGARLSGDSDDVTFSLMSGWDRVTAYITVDITNNTVRSNDVYIGRVEDAGDGWKRVAINFSEMPLEASGAETVDRMNFHWVNHAFLLYNVSTAKAYYTGEEVSTGYGYSSDNDATFSIDNFATSGKAISFEYKPIDKNTNNGTDFAFSLMSGWNR
ncbi:MAG: hypothetical protein J6Y43_07205, partial [Clostridia bacterium]|nr:hypothetical protein [Clostridia bacterium]